MPRPMNTVSTTLSSNIWPKLKAKAGNFSKS